MDTFRVGRDRQIQAVQEGIKALGVLVFKSVEPAVGSCEIVYICTVLRVVETVEIITVRSAEHKVIRVVVGIFQPPALLLFSVADHDAVCFIPGIQGFFDADAFAVMRQPVIGVLFQLGDKAFRRGSRGF